MAAVAVRGFPSTVSRLPLRRATLRQRGAQSTVAMAAADMQEKIKSTTASNPVVVYSKTYCPCVPSHALSARFQSFAQRERASQAMAGMISTMIRVQVLHQCQEPLPESEREGRRRGARHHGR